MSLLQRDLDFDNLIKLTIEWNRIGAGGQYDMSEQRKQLQHECLLEELQELEDAIAANDEVEIVDALCDILFVGIYAAFMNERVFTDQYHYEQRLARVMCAGVFNPDQAESTPEYFVEDIEHFIEADMYWHLIELIISYSINFNFDLKKAYENVVMSNWTKYPLIEDVNLAAELEWFKTSSKYKDVVAQEVDGHYVFRCDNGNGKVVKWAGYKEPQLKQFIWEN